MPNRRRRVVLDLNVLQGLPKQATLRPEFELVLSKVLLPEILRRARAKHVGRDERDREIARAKAACAKARAHLTDTNLKGRVHVGEFSWDITHREPKPSDVTGGVKGIIPGSSESLDRFRDPSQLLPEISRDDLRVQKEFEVHERSWVKLLRSLAGGMLDTAGTKSMRLQLELHSMFRRREQREAFYEHMSVMFRGRLDRPAWKRYIIKSPETAARPAICRVGMLMMYYSSLLMEGPSTSDATFRNNFRDNEYAVLASYVGALCTGDAGLRKACSCVFGPRVQLLRMDDVFVLPD